jgi:hypothetical protein
MRIPASPRRGRFNREWSMAIMSPDRRRLPSALSGVSDGNAPNAAATLIRSPDPRRHCSAAKTRARSQMGHQRCARRRKERFAFLVVQAEDSIVAAKRAADVDSAGRMCRHLTLCAARSSMIFKKILIAHPASQSFIARRLRALAIGGPSFRFALHAFVARSDADCVMIRVASGNGDGYCDE